MTVKLRYIGDGSYFPGVPAADHECDDGKEAERLVASGLYAYVREPKKDKDEGGLGDASTT